eukprot:1631998-Rhodomonas_salina.1
MPVLPQGTATPPWPAFSSTLVADVKRGIACASPRPVLQEGWQAPAQLEIVSPPPPHEACAQASRAGCADSLERSAKGTAREKGFAFAVDEANGHEEQH